MDDKVVACVQLALGSAKDTEAIDEAKETVFNGLVDQSKSDVDLLEAEFEDVQAMVIEQPHEQKY